LEIDVCRVGSVWTSLDGQFASHGVALGQGVTTAELAGPWRKNAEFFRPWAAKHGKNRLELAKSAVITGFSGYLGLKFWGESI
jgi:hypothetical protein